ncbi:OVARIAN TUMOR DOMAIN-containing deubiquitinating enzyme 7 [Citrus sinensis]|uniref:OTU domain-containing protein 3 isoform X2 n=1 Tax=Citrus clementina TaxID=85681 RepID=UPI000CED20C2|nr:OTU domain-containing protein 3 isoform X2 [Citrus x clementina]KAH9663647.1 OVARIAN TUMOR DOMAIN-containing deubiquitinating enzyme 7 [Citrus sinensis]
MVKAKPQKSKLKKQPHTKTHGKQADVSKFRTQLDILGLKIIQVTADGNCFFRALADQLEGNEEEHQKYRSMVVQYIVKNRETFEPFIEDDVPFDEYCQSMETDGTWAGHMELQAASLVTHSNICIHRHMSPRWYIRNFDYHEARMIHLSYHDGEHYNSVRLKEDSCIGSARPIIIKADADISAASIQSKTVTSKLKGAAGIINAGSIKLVMAGSGCENSEKVEEVLLQVGGDVDAAIEFLIAEQGTEEYSVKSNNAEMSYGDNENGNSEQHEEERLNKTCDLDKSSNSIKRSHDDSRFKPNEKIPRNKVCPCGSKKKYKACCGTAAGRSSTKFAVNQTVDSKRGRKERKQGKKGEASSTLSACVSDGGPPDMGALCI